MHRGKRRLHVVAPVAATLACLAAVRVPPSDDISVPALLALTAWVRAVDDHQPGVRDDAVAFAWTLDEAARLDLDDAMGPFLGVLLGTNIVTDSDTKKRVAELGRERSGAATAFLERAAILHTDAAIAGRNRPRSLPPPGDAAARAAARKSPLFSSTTLILDTDGEFVGQTGSDWNWTFARSLLDLVPARTADPFVGFWYHTVATFLLRNGLYGDAGAHLEHASKLFPDDPSLLFDRACLSEINGLPITQQLLTDEDLTALRLRRAGRPSSFTSRVQLSPLAKLAGLPPPEVANEEAERLVRRVLSRNPDFTEARVRLARLLDLRGRHAEAEKELSNALAAASNPVVMFYAHLFAARANRALGALEAAAQHYDAALALFPDAQSALVGASQIALLRADLPRALAVVARLPALSQDSPRGTDPWWDYRLGSGRDVDPLLEQLWTRTPARDGYNRSREGKRPHPDQN